MKCCEYPPPELELALQNVDSLTISSHVRQKRYELEVTYDFLFRNFAGRILFWRRKNGDTQKISLHVRQKWCKIAVSDIFW
jgi:hypothetical protein